MCYPICGHTNSKGGIIMLKFQNNNTTLISTFKDFILTVYVVIDDLYHQFAPPEAISRRHVIVIRKGFLSILLYDSFKDFIITNRPNFAFTAFIFWLYSIYIYFMGSDPITLFGKSNPKAVESSVAYKALVRIGAIYDLEGSLKALSAEERLKERQASVKPLVEEFFSWLRKIQADRSVLPKSETAKGINYCLNQEGYLKVFLSDGEVPIDNLASERALRTFTIGRKNWMTINTVRGAEASAIIYSVTETARANGLNVYYYMKHLLTELTQAVRADGSINEKDLEPLMPWSKDLPAECYNKRRK